MIEAVIRPKINFLFTPVVNYAIQQNRIPLIRKFSIENCTDEDWENIKIEIHCEPEIASRWEHQIDVIPAGQNLNLDVKNFRLSAKILSQLTEKITGEIRLRITTGEQVVFQKNYIIDILAYDQWNGIRVFPEMIGAFITPNHPGVFNILKKASHILEEWTGSPSFDAYQSLNPDRVKKQMAAIYEAIADLKIVYCSPPASFEQEGQRIRMCDAVFSQKLATCIDMALLYTSCMEAIGLNTLIVVMNGHAFAGAWMVEQFFADSVNDDISLLKKRIADGINEIGLVETTCMNAGKQVPFDTAMNEANHKLRDEKNFILFIDIKRARHSGIKPLPQRVKTPDGWLIDEENGDMQHGDAPEEIIAALPDCKEQQQILTKQKLWERKLLDLSLRNNLLNLKITKSTIQLILIDLNLCEDELADGPEFQILPIPAELEKPSNAFGIFQIVNPTEPIVNLLKNEVKQKKIRSYLSVNDLGNALSRLYRSSKLSLEENGANTLYLALGLLKWFETPKSEIPRYAPLLLFPVEIIRKSAQKGYVIRSTEDETIVNVTLFEMLRQDFGIMIPGVDALPEDEKGIDLQKVFNIVRQGIMSQARWNVEEQAFLGNFSFNKFIMWNDIHNNSDKLKDHKIVSSLISGKIEWDVSGSHEKSIDIDQNYSPSDIALPISADSSQIEAVTAAMKNKSFILHGPPGTGKSQTITNIIANALYQGKRVLFVAEKMAALSVVQKRLTNVGLDPFCLELHSSKAKKSTILAQLQRATEVIKKTSPLEYKKEAERLYALRLDLNAYVDSLHKVYPFGFSLFDCFNGYAQFNNCPDCVVLDISFLHKLEGGKFTECTDAVEELKNAGTLCGHPFNHPLSEINTTEYSQQIKSQARALIVTYQKLLDQFIDEREGICNWTEIDFSVLQKEQDFAISHIATELLNLPDLPSDILQIKNIAQGLKDIVRFAGHGVKRDSFRGTLLTEFKKEILQYDADAALEKWETTSKKWFLLRWIQQYKLLNTIKPLTKSGKVNKENYVFYLGLITQYNKEQKILNENADFLSRTLGFLWKGGNGNWSKIIQICESVIRIHDWLISLTGDPQITKDIHLWLASQLSDGIQTFRRLNGGKLHLYIDLLNQIKEIEQQLSDLLDIDFSNQEIVDKDWVLRQKQQTEKWLDGLDDLRDWTSWNKAVKEAEAIGLIAVIDCYRNGTLKNEHVVDAFYKGIYRLGAEYIISTDPNLAAFNGKLFENKIERYNVKNKYFQELTKAELYAKLAAAIPAFTLEAAQTSEIGILQRAIRNRARGMSVRRLFDLIPNLLPRLCPCMLMSPISVAQYFEVDQTKFDLVIFDEASQMPTCEAVGAIARGKNVIVVGDPNQMPPTNFFSTNKFDEENAEMEDLESILDDCLALSMPSMHLLWHYRSKHESLIAFSNSNYYNNKLLTFPSPDDLATKVNNIHVPGFYDRGNTRQNRFEAKAIVNEVMQRLADPMLSQRSIGIVTFSAAQQNLIDDLLNEALKRHPELDAVAMESNEPIFIKNLENVQGDERDVILFSMGYGPDREGHVSLNFGPLNRDGGWRRLNVAVSRARYEMKVYSTLRSEQIDITRTTSEGVAGIKAFLEYSEKGKMVLSQKNYTRKINSNSFEKMVAEEIRKFDYTVHTDIGCSGYKIDIGVVNPDAPSEYLLGILTDGENYRSAQMARDREIIRREVLQLLGWNIYKLWSPDWWDNPKEVILDILTTIDRIQKQENAEAPVAEQRKLSSAYNEKKLENTEILEITQQVIVQEQKYEKYEICVLPITSIAFSDDFFEPLNKEKIQSQIREVIHKEAPISQILLAKRVLNAWGIARLGIRLSTYLNSLFVQLNLKYTSQNNIIFYWREDQNPAEYKKFRVPVDNKHKRNMEDIPKEEIAVAIIHILTTQISLPLEDLIRETSHLFGFNRMGGNLENAVKMSADYAMEKGTITENNDRIVLS